MPLFNRFIETALTAKNKVLCELALLPTSQRPETLVRIEAVHDEAGQECRMVLIDISSEKAAEKAVLESTQYQRALLDNFPFGIWLKDKDSGLLAVNMPFAQNSREPSAAALEENERRYRSFIENLPLGIAIAQDGVLKYINPKATELMGHTPEECIGHDFLPFIAEADRAVATEALRACLAGEANPPEFNLRVLNKQGRAVDCRVHLSVVAWEEQIAVMGIFENLPERQLANAALRRLSTIDTLTELDNRRHFMNRVDKALSRLRRDVSQQAAVLVLAMDQFSAINDRRGQTAGDAALRFIAGVLRDELRREDTAGRIGDEEFAILLPGSDLAAATVFAERLRKLIAGSNPSIGNQPVSITVSIGVSVIDATDPSEEPALARANEALHRARAAGGDRFEVALPLAANTDSPGHIFTPLGQKTRRPPPIAPRQPPTRQRKRIDEPRS